MSRSFILFFQSGVEGISSSWTPNFLEQIKEFSKENALYALSFVVFGIGAGRILLSLLLRFVHRRIILYISMVIAAFQIVVYIAAAVLLIWAVTQIAIFVNNKSNKQPPS